MRTRRVRKLFDLLKDTEKIDFRQWLMYSCGDKQAYVQKLYSCMLENSDPDLGEEEVWAHLYPETPYDDARFRKLCRDLSRHLEHYLSFKNFENDKRGQDISLLQAFNKREAAELFLKFSKKLKRNSKNEFGKDAGYYRYLYEIEVEIQRYLSKYVRNYLEREKLFPGQYADMLTFFDNWWAEEKLNLAIGKSNLRLQNPENSQELLLDELVEKLAADKSGYFNERLQVNMRVYKLLKGEEMVKVGTLIEHIKTSQRNALWTEEELRNFLTSLINTYIRKLNKLGDQDTAKEIFSLFEWGIESRLFFVDHHLPEVVYKNLINICLRVSYFDEAREYLEGLKHLLPDTRRDECYRFNLGRYYFFKGAYKELITCFSGQRFSHVNDEIDARTYLLQAQYELSSEEPEWLLKQLSTLLRFVKYQKLRPEMKTSIINGFRLFKKLLLAYTNFEYEQVLKQIQSTRPLYRADWLERKAASPLKKRPDEYPAS